MILRLERDATVNGATFGQLFIDGRAECLTLEDAIREQPGIQVASWKVKGQTAIPVGTYRVVITPSQRFHRLLPEILVVPGFSGVRLHPGNTTADTEGCILVGKTKNRDGIAESRLAFESLFRQLVAADEPITIEITNPPVAPASEIRRA